MVINNIDEIVKFTNGKIDFFILQDNACSEKCPINNPYDEYSINNVFLKKEKEFYSRNKKKIENLDYYIKEYKKFNERKKIQLKRKKNVDDNKNENLKENSSENKSIFKYIEEDEELNDNLSENKSNEFSDGSYVYKSDTTVSHCYDNLVNWMYCRFNSFNINIYVNSPNNIFKESKNIFIIKEFNKEKINALKDIYSTYTGLNTTYGVFFYTVNYCIMLALECNRIDLLKNKMKNFKILYKFENIEKYVFLKNNLKDIDNIDKSNVYLTWKYPNLFSSYSFIDENNFFQKNKTKKLFKESFLCCKDFDKINIEKKCCENKSNEENENIKNKKSDEEDIRKKGTIYKYDRISFPRRNLEVIHLNNKLSLKNIFAIYPQFYLDDLDYIYIKDVGDIRKINNKCIEHDEKLKKIKVLLNRNQNNNTFIDDTYSNYLYFRKTIHNLKSSILHYDNNKKYKKKLLDDYKFIYKKINSNYIKEGNQKGEKKKKIFLLLNKELNYYPYFFYDNKYSYHFKGFSYIGEDYGYHEYQNYYIHNIENKIYFVLPLAYNYTLISIKNEPICLIRGYGKKFSFYFPYDYKKGEVIYPQDFEQSNEKYEKNDKKENYKERHVENNLNKIYSLSYNYFDDTIIAGSKNCIFIFDIHDPIFKKKITLLNKEKKKIGKITSICLVHYYEELQNKDNEIQQINLSKNDELYDNKINETKMKNNKVYSKNMGRKKEEKFLSKEHYQCKSLIKKYFSKYEKIKQNIFFIGTNKGIIYMFNEKEEILDENKNNYIISKTCFITLKNSSVIQIMYYDEKKIIASSLNDIFIRLYGLNSKYDNTKFYRENRDNQKYHFDILKDFLFTGDLYGNILIYDLKNKNMIFKKKLTYSPIICVSINKLLPLMLIATSYNYSHSVSNYIYKKNKKIIINNAYKNKGIENASKSIFMTSMSLWYIYELYNLYS
ncbi:hypothetical protein PGAL8A_00425900 [Plasmodium gallinaceum]|uniref:Uncharacterized protein n=1 Tax=Plasmodium gallinaceum TaxID=5849 RepID=A0A1J1GWP0_PLAGA|nr:hypothetical protein PGAL8A_00425900 [Plasmodium gallinaceum]CRG96679.1 hypothetical protein PGAL8A_00425900 [Plasmodium gallinaceum]